MRRLSPLSFVLLCITQPASAAPENPLSQAKQTVEAYQNLRNHCAQSRDQARQDCLSQLASTSDTYRAAKLQLATAPTPPRLASNRR